MKVLRVGEEFFWKAVLIAEFYNGAFFAYVSASYFSDKASATRWRDMFLSTLIAKCCQKRPSFRFFLKDNPPFFNENEAWEWGHSIDPEKAASFFLSETFRGWMKLAASKGKK
ncbi:MAG: hypothetical protein WC858_01570 [Parcubacteria group bacterium]|jgi:hypothetical protein